MGRTRTVAIRVSETEFAKYTELAPQLDSTLSEMGREAFLIALPTLVKRAKLLHSKEVPL